MSKKVIVMMFDGDEPSTSLITKISGLIKCYNHDIDRVDVSVYDFTELAAILAKKTVRRINVEESNDVVANSLIVIGRYLADIPFVNDIAFMLEVSKRISSARLNMSAETNKAFINALDILEGYTIRSTKERQKIMEKYKLSKEKLQFIITAYRIYKNGKDMA